MNSSLEQGSQGKQHPLYPLQNYVLLSPESQLNTPQFEAISVCELEMDRKAMAMEKVRL